MAWFRRRSKFKLEPFDFSELPVPDPITVDEALEEGLMLAEYASRMRVKNKILVEVLRKGAPYDPERFQKLAISSLGRLADESQAAGERIAKERRASSDAYGRSGHVHDYRAADGENLEHREKLSLAVATELRRRAADPEYLATHIERAREDAWRDVGGNIEFVLDRQHVPSAIDPDYERTKAERMRSLIVDDLAALADGARERVEARAVSDDLERAMAAAFAEAEAAETQAAGAQKTTTGETKVETVDHNEHQGHQDPEKRE